LTGILAAHALALRARGPTVVGQSIGYARRSQPLAKAP